MRQISRSSRVDRNEGLITRSPCAGAGWTGSRSRRLVALIAIRSLGAASQPADSPTRRLADSVSAGRRHTETPAHMSSRACAHEATGLARDEAGFGDVPAATASGCLASDAHSLPPFRLLRHLCFSLFFSLHTLSATPAAKYCRVPNTPADWGGCADTTETPCRR